MSAQTDRLEAVQKEMRAIAEMQEELRETRKALAKEFNEINTVIRSKKLRKRKWLYISANTASTLWAYGTKVRVIQHTRKSKRFTAGAWVQRRGKEQWFSYQYLSADKPENGLMTQMNRFMAKQLDKIT